MKKLLFVGWYPNSALISHNVFFRNLIYAMADEGMDCTVIAPVKITKGFSEAIKVPKEEIETTPGGNKVRVLHPRMLSASAKQIGGFNTGRISEYCFEQAAISTAKKLEGKFDAVYGHFLLYGGIAAVRIGRMLGIPSFIAYGECSYQSEVKKLYGDVTRAQIEGLSGIIPVSTKNKNELDSLGIFSDVPKIIVPNAVDAGLFHKRDKAKCRRALGLPEDKFIVGFVGDFIERKGDKRLLAAVNATKNVYAAFVGEGAQPPSGERVLFCQRLAHEDVAVFLGAVDAFCLPTLNEGSCNAVIEAMACGAPVISSALPFNDDILTDDNAIRIDPNSVEQIQAALEALCESAALREKLSENALKTAAGLRIDARARRILSFMENPKK